MIPLGINENGLLKVIKHNWHVEFPSDIWERRINLLCCNAAAVPLAYPYDVFPLLFKIFFSIVL